MDYLPNRLQIFTVREILLCILYYYINRLINICVMCMHEVINKYACVYG